MKWSNFNAENDPVAGSLLGHLDLAVGGELLSAEFGEQVSWVNRLSENLEFMALSASFLQQVGGSGLTREKENLTVGHPRACNDGCFDACHTGHDDVADEHVGLKGFERFNGFFTTEYCASFKACLIENDRKGVGDHLLVVRDEYPGL